MTKEREKLEEYIGEPCEEFNPDCSTCRAWGILEEYDQLVREVTEWEADNGYDYDNEPL